MVDTNVAFSASKSISPLSEACRLVLETMMMKQHRVVLSATQYWEWQKHQSGYSKAWLARMIAKKQHVVLTPEPDSGLTDRIYRLDCADKTRAEILKDVHLLENALATDHAVVSQETNVLALFIAHAQPLQIPRPVAWVNPAENPAVCIAWLEKGAATDAVPFVPAGI
ncbi:hypothetical protein [Hymenobacter cheonanensis]|uniref:hypothetical protein n=1 Tax=Hymenobacter sp. CA2-7 TaxID=3063993 RepID=UPI002713BF77|nr:hypothetical protein [Hymenobacter sp. CA2-7]MDO7886959.1 hypothetical protein [Hymenobacter sp. CA2-7]